MTHFLSALIAQVTESVSLTGVLITTQTALSAAVVALYRDCRKDREKLWAHVRDLERRISGRD